MPEKNTDTTRDTVTFCLHRMMIDAWPQATVTKSENGSGCPIIKITFSDGRACNVTITRARS